MIVAYYGLHYGREYLWWSMRAIRDSVDAIVVAYSDRPSHGTNTTYDCPDTKEQLQAIAKYWGAYWIDVNNALWEGQHRDLAVGYCQDMGADIILPVDHDEIWDKEHLSRVLDYVKTTDYRDYRVSMQHFWRSMDWVCRDPALPARVIRLAGQGENYVPHMGYIHHFGYAQSPLTIEYKWRIHGHIGEIRPGWYERTFLPWKPGGTDVHPTSIDYWTPAAFSKRDIHHLLGDHPYYGMDLIDNTWIDYLDNRYQDNGPIISHEVSKFGGLR